MYKGIIFDFNGTLYWDSHMHKQAWRIFSKELRGYEFTDVEMLKYMFGRTNEEIIEYAIGTKPTPEMVEQYAQVKESLYRQMCLDHKDQFHLAQGAIEFLNFLKDNNIPRTIATMSDKTNVDFFFKYLELSNWFDYDKVVYADGKIPSKPAPDIYKIAANNLKLATKDCIVVEDAISRIDSAYAAGIGKIIAICSEEPESFYKDIPSVAQIIHKFDEINKSDFCILTK